MYTHIASMGMVRFGFHGKQLGVNHFTSVDTSGSHCPVELSEIDDLCIILESGRRTVAVEGDFDYLFTVGEQLRIASNRFEEVCERQSTLLKGLHMSLGRVFGMEDLAVVLLCSKIPDFHGKVLDDGAGWLEDFLQKTEDLQERPTIQLFAEKMKGNA